QDDRSVISELVWLFIPHEDEDAKQHGRHDHEHNLHNGTKSKRHTWVSNPTNRGHALLAAGSASLTIMAVCSAHFSSHLKSGLPPHTRSSSPINANRHTDHTLRASPYLRSVQHSGTKLGTTG